MKLQIQGNQNYQSTGFKGVNIVRISKTAFPNPNNLKDVETLFNTALNKALKEETSKCTGFFSSLLLRIRRAFGNQETKCVLEGPLYIEINELLKLKNFLLIGLRRIPNSY